MDIAAIAAVAQSQPVTAGRTNRDALAQEVGTMVFRALLPKIATHGKPSGTQAVSWDFFTDHVARNLALQHRQLFSEMLFQGRRTGS